jgi:flagellar FliL protein
MKKWLWVMIAGGLLAVVIIVGVIYVTRPHSKTKVILSPTQLQTLQYTVPSLTTNLSDNSMIQTTIVLQTDSQNTMNTLTNSTAQVNNDVISVLNDTSGAEINMPNGLSLLRQRLITALSSFGKITKVYFTQFIVQ